MGRESKAWSCFFIPGEPHSAEWYRYSRKTFYSRHSSLKFCFPPSRFMPQQDAWSLISLFISSPSVWRVLMLSREGHPLSIQRTVRTTDGRLAGWPAGRPYDFIVCGQRKCSSRNRNMNNSSLKSCTSLLPRVYSSPESQSECE